MATPLRVLIVVNELTSARYTTVCRRLETANDVIEALDTQDWDIVIPD